ncbi:MAG: translation initiation factor IF-1 [Methanobrevibacter sp.]|jgi:translation initiation factor IF-1|nr:translation initiation factor IF-1 [Candidatus Methanoflexus mossambicus]
MGEYSSEIEGIVVESLNSQVFCVKLENGHVIHAKLSNKMHTRKISVCTNDRVLVEITPFDPNHGNITYRYR